VIVTVPAGATTGTVSVPTTADTIDEGRNFQHCYYGTVSATGTIIDNNNAPTVATITLLRLPKDLMFDFALGNPSAVVLRILLFTTNGTAGSADYTTTDVIVTVPAGATTGTVSPTTADTIDEVDEFSIASGTASATGTISM
jgi:hypothetical protein